MNHPNVLGRFRCFCHIYMQVRLHGDSKQQGPQLRQVVWHREQQVLVRLFCRPAIWHTTCLQRLTSRKDVPGTRKRACGSNEDKPGERKGKGGCLRRQQLISITAFAYCQLARPLLAPLRAWQVSQCRCQMMRLSASSCCHFGSI